MLQGFLMVFVLFLCCAAAYDQLVKHALHWFQVTSGHQVCLLGGPEPSHMCIHEQA